MAHLVTVALLLLRGGHPGRCGIANHLPSEATVALREQTRNRGRRRERGREGRRKAERPR
eukprot:scaffold150455_cov30-Tisochrysis_lutea.AAC.2